MNFIGMRLGPFELGLIPAILEGRRHTWDPLPPRLGPIIGNGRESVFGVRPARTANGIEVEAVGVGADDGRHTSDQLVRLVSRHRDTP